MGLDIALGIMVLLGAIRGWFRGFVLQAIRLGGLVGCVYAAGPIRDYARPHVVALPGLDPAVHARPDALVVVGRGLVPDDGRPGQPWP